MKKGSFQTYLTIPLNLDSLIAQDHIVRQIRKDVDSMDLSCLEDLYSDNKGRPPYNVYDLLAATLYGFTQGISSCRKLANASKENICMMWLLNMETPNHATYNNFQHRIASVNTQIMTEQIKLLLRKGLIDKSLIAIDGTKIQSRSNKYKSVYRGSVGYHERNMEDKIANQIFSSVLYDSENSNISIPEEISEIISKEDFTQNKYTKEKSKNRNYKPRISFQELTVLINWLNSLDKELINDDSNLKELYNNIDNYLLRKLKYEEQRKKLGNRNSYSKTDEDASFMRLKDDSFDSKVLSPAYNVQIAECNGFVLGSTVSNEASDTRQLKGVIEELEEIEAIDSNSTILADAGYGSQENYEIMDEKGYDHIVPYMSQRYEEKRKYKNNPCTPDKFKVVDKEYAICPGGRKMQYTYSSKSISKSGYVTIKDIYTTDKCKGCAFQEVCSKGKQSRSLYYDRKWMNKKNEIKEKFSKKENLSKYKCRSVVEQNFGIIKACHNLSRFQHIGIKKNKAIFNLHVIAANLVRAYHVKCEKIPPITRGKSEVSEGKLVNTRNKMKIIMEKWNLHISWQIPFNILFI